MPEYIACSYGVMMVHTDSKEPVSSDFITPGFDPSIVDPNKPQTITTWKNLFLATNLESKIIDNLPQIQRNNAHISAVGEYLKKKFRKKMVLIDEIPEWLPPTAIPDLLLKFNK